jgi:hypothetical protein
MVLNFGRLAVTNQQAAKRHTAPRTWWSGGSSEANQNVFGNLSVKFKQRTRVSVPIVPDVCTSSPNIIRENESKRMGWVGDMARDGEICTGFSWSNLKKIPHMEEQGVDGVIKWILCRMGVDRLNLIQDRYKWHALVKTVMNLRAV